MNLGNLNQSDVGDVFLNTDDFATTISVERTGEEPFVITAIFDERGEDIFDRRGEFGEITVSVPSILIATTDSDRIEKGHSLVIDGIEYRYTTRMVDDPWVTRMLLEKKR